jgi:hypothetical protein
LTELPSKGVVVQKAVDLIAGGEECRAVALSAATLDGRLGHEDAAAQGDNNIAGIAPGATMMRTVNSAERKRE